MTTKRVLVTGARAPSTLELIKNLAKDGCEVYAVDSVPFALGFYTKSVKAYEVVPPAKQETDHFIHKLIEVIQRYQIDLLIPTCEEIFYIAKYKEELEKYTSVFCENLERLTKLHHKYNFIELAKSFGLPVPSTILCTEKERLVEGLNKVAKPVFSRFSTNVINLNKQKLDKIKVDGDHPWVVQDYIEGREFCSYSIAKEGKLLAHTVYESKFHAGDGATIQFQSVEHEAINNWVATFIENYHFSGQIAFDFRVSPSGEVFAIECNPRLTSGVHLFRERSLVQAFLGQRQNIIAPQDKPMKMTLPLVWFLFPNIKKNGVRATGRALLHGQDIVWDQQDKQPFWKQVGALYHFWRVAKRHHISTMEATTYDISWDG